MEIIHFNFESVTHRFLKTLIITRKVLHSNPYLSDKYCCLGINLFS
ncbi:Uncharacterised protein [Legionella maceachernii]|nr:hypothetical protein SAMN02745128_00314 [Legionella maceachernii]SUP03700.1 Uncharacterised protein [Legionella maceachernii]